MNTIESPSGLPIHYCGPPLEEGKLPAFFYFALSGDDSLNLDPFNQPAAFLDPYPIRVFSFTIPGHGPGLKNTDALKKWAEKIKKGLDPLTPFFNQSEDNINFLIEHDLVDEEKVAIGGLSRGGFVALHLASRDPRLGIVLGYAPLTTTETIQEFSDIRNNSITQTLKLNTNALIGKKIRLYIGNRDLRVSTDACYQLVKEVVDYSYDQNIRSPETELFISSSIGHKGHGTSPHIFKDGAEWIASLLTENSL